ncbi:hypothetical protein ZIOFF_005902 [Zingiber officinale]|uniref:Uncharacterized protein n=1 Tax=Zingiber officinale TaxID=94328 RepID=A0A8J5LRZ1_ZINOF|nr:hypothetical protein ZIOFF_005902 [Zingiber officinale]
MGGPSFNPTGNVALYAARFGDDTLISMAICFLAQAVGVIGGLLALYEVMSSEYKNLLVEPYLKVDLHTGAIAEGVLTFVITVVVLCIIFKGPWSALVKTLMITICTLGVIIVGNDYTGSSMYPANVSAPDFSVTFLLLSLSVCIVIPSSSIYCITSLDPPLKFKDGVEANKQVSPIHIESGNADAPKVLVSFRVFTYSVNAGNYYVPTCYAPPAYSMEVDMIMLSKSGMVTPHT